MVSMTLRPHHILDIIATYGAGDPFVPSDNGSAVPAVASLLLADPDLPIRLVARVDDICKPCRMLRDGRTCTNVLAQLEHRPSMQEYNDALDRRLLAFLGLREEEETTVRRFLKAVAAALPGVMGIATHPGETEDVKRNNVAAGLRKLEIAAD